jgi:hypothetical protein
VEYDVYQPTMTIPPSINSFLKKIAFKSLIAVKKAMSCIPIAYAYVVYENGKRLTTLVG